MKFQSPNAALALLKARMLLSQHVDINISLLALADFPIPMLYWGVLAHQLKSRFLETAICQVDGPTARPSGARENI